MPKFAANLTLLFKEYPPTERIDQAAAAGFEFAEILFPYDQPAPEILAALRRHEMGLVLINCPPPNYTGGAPGFAAQPAQQERFRRDFKRTLRYAQVLKPHHVHIMAGAAEGGDAQECYLENLRWAADQAPGQSLTIEPINKIDMPGYFLADFDQALEIIKAVDRPNLGLQFDVYHAHKITGDANAAWEKYQEHVVHVQIGGVPDRHEPTGDGFNYPRFFANLDAQGYEGYVSAEYHPRTTTENGLGWLPKS